VIFAAAKSTTGNAYVYKLFALNLSNGAKISESVIQGQVPGSGIGATGAGANKKITFDPLYELNRPALLLNGNILYVAFGGHCDRGPYHGWFSLTMSQTRLPPKSWTSSAALRTAREENTKAAPESGCRARVLPPMKMAVSILQPAMGPITAQQTSATAWCP
jgi:hypothetical protein